MKERLKAIIRKMETFEKEGKDFDVVETSVIGSAITYIEASCNRRHNRKKEYCNVSGCNVKDVQQHTHATIGQ